MVGYFDKYQQFFKPIIAKLNGDPAVKQRLNRYKETVCTLCCIPLCALWFIILSLSKDYHRVHKVFSRRAQRGCCSLEQGYFIFPVCGQADFVISTDDRRIQQSFLQ